MDTIRTFISTVDHLPCDIIRSIWLIQLCNIAVDNNRRRLDEILLQIHNGSSKQELIKEIVQIQETIQRYSLESILEATALQSQLISHKSYLDEEVVQLNSEKKSDADTEEEMKKLRQQLEEHYAIHPLASQREAIQEKADQSSGLKLILKLPKKQPKKKRIREVKIEKKQLEKKQLEKKKKAVQEILIEFEKEDEELYCFCRQPSFGDMIACDNSHCVNEWFHYKCVGMLKSTKINTRWFCSDNCRDEFNNKKKKKKRW